MSSTAGFEIEVDQAALQEALSLYEHIGIKAADAIRIGLNKTAPKIRTQASRAIRSQVNLKAKYVNDRLDIQRATRATLAAKIITPARGRLLSLFSTDTQIANDTVRWISAPPVPRTGIKVKVKPGSARPVTGHPDIKGKPFYLVLKNSRRLAIAGRLKDEGPQGGRFKVFYGPSLSQVFFTVRDEVLPEAQEELTRQMLDAVRYLVAKKLPPDEAPV